MQNLPNGKSNSVFFPDGTLCPRPPDGYKFTSATGEEWLWDGFLDKWEKQSKAGKGQTSLMGWPWSSMYSPDTEGDMPIKQQVQATLEKKCECGSEKAGAFGHSRWCPKFEELK